jgi:hypothetical protein
VDVQGDGIRPQIISLPTTTNRHGSSLAFEFVDGSERLGVVDELTVHPYSLNMNLLSELKLAPAFGPMPPKKSLDSPLKVIHKRKNIFSFEFSETSAGYYQVDLEIKGTLADGRLFTETTLTIVTVLTEDLAVVRMEQQAIAGANGSAARAEARMTIDAVADGDVRVTALLRSADLAQAEPPNPPFTQMVFHAKPGLQNITVPLPKEILADFAQDLRLVISVAPASPPADGKRDRNVTYWNPDLGGWGNGRKGYFRVVLKPTSRQ